MIGRLARLAIVSVVAVGCGRLDFDPLTVGQVGSDAAITTTTPDAPADAPCTFGAFSAPTTIASLNSPQTDRGPAFSHDGLTLTFSSDRTGGFLLYQSTRTAIGAPWTTPAVVVGPTGNTQDDPYVSADGLQLFFGGSGGVAEMTRTSTTSPWVGQTIVLGGTATYGAAGGPDLTPDGLTLTYTVTLVADDEFHMLTTTRASKADAFTAGTEPPGLFDALGESYGSMSADLLEVFYSRDMMPEGLLRASRATVSDPFSGAATIPALIEADATEDGDVDISDDGLMLVFSSSRAGGVGSFDLWFATRTCT